MKPRHCIMTVIAALMAGAPPARAVSSAITYQGQIQQNQVPFNGACDLQFSLYTAPVGGSGVGLTQAPSNVPVVNGVFSVQLDFGAGSFSGADRWLQMATRCPAGGGSFTTLSPRQLLTAAPYALLANSVADNAVTSAQIADGAVSNGKIADGAVTNAKVASGIAYSKLTGVPATLPPSGPASGGLSGSYPNPSIAANAIGSGQIADGTVGSSDLANGAVTAAKIAPGSNGQVLTTQSGAVSWQTPSGGSTGWSLTGNAGTTANNFLGTTDNQPVIVRVNNQYVLRLYDGINASDRAPNVIVGAPVNEVALGVVGATIAGGGAAPDRRNSVSKDFGTVGGGHSNTSSGYGSTVGGGLYNDAVSGYYPTVGGGHGNTASGDWSTVGGGDENTASGSESTVGGGDENTASKGGSTVGGGYENTASGEGSTVGGGRGNTASEYYSTVGGGDRNGANGFESTIAGGGGNTASGERSAIGGGQFNLASMGYSVVGGGKSNQALGGTLAIVGGEGNVARGPYSAIGGGKSNSTGIVATGAVVPGGESNQANGAYSFAAGYHARANADGCFAWSDASDGDFTCSTPNRFMARAAGGVIFYTTPFTTTGSQLAAGGGSWSSVSDRNVKRDVEAVDPQAVLDKVVATPVNTWSYVSQDPSIRHIGPMAQDFHAAFGVGEDDTHITTVDADGVALAAIQGLHRLVQEKDARIAALEARLAALEERVGAQ